MTVLFGFGKFGVSWRMMALLGRGLSTMTSSTSLFPSVTVTFFAIS
ncbi:predicted protein [Streptomyces iranensis]|uniref:Uncharacterized protein n=1 Tax=Streptomyces iranensis TaxID=576784 RepID=A0A060ZW52_9ACTN|nr:predicted protein [Streptomyces iranensis]